VKLFAIGGNMDALTEMWNKAHDADEKVDFHSFQLGVTAGAVSMKARAMNCVVSPGQNLRENDIINHIKNSIGQLSDIPSKA